MQRLSPLSFAFGFAAFFGLLAPPSAGCSAHDHTAATAAEEAVFEGTANDEALAQLDAQKSAEDASRAPQLTAPPAGAKVSAATPALFEWKPTPTGSLQNGARRQRYAGSSPFGAMREAHAHGTPLNGKAYLLTLKDAKGGTALRVFTSNTSFRPDAAKWDTLKVAAQPLRVTLTTSGYDNNNLLQGSAFSSPASAITIE